MVGHTIEPSRLVRMKAIEPLFYPCYFFLGFLFCCGVVGRVFFLPTGIVFTPNKRRRIDAFKVYLFGFAFQLFFNWFISSVSSFIAFTNAAIMGLSLTVLFSPSP